MSDLKTILVAPNGMWADRTYLHYGAQGAHILSVDHRGMPDDWNNDDYPSSDLLQTDLSTAHVSTSDGEYLSDHCRQLEVDVNALDTDEVLMPPWPAEIDTLCRKADTLAFALFNLERLRTNLPDGWDADPTIKAAMETILRGRIEGELKDILDRVEKWTEAHGHEYSQVT